MGIDILRPFGILIVHQDRDPDDNEVEPEEQDDAQPPPVEESVPSILSTPCSRELEDALTGEDLPEDFESSNFDRFFLLDGVKVNKA